MGEKGWLKAVLAEARTEVQRLPAWAQYTRTQVQVSPSTHSFGPYQPQLPRASADRGIAANQTACRGEK